ncbi:MAG TPA: hypothetical protein VFV85_04630 [Conexibacter sp.]|nr:hypothetical protein [Conexibacter sp.]
MSVAAPARVRALHPSELAWIALLPCALVTLALIVLVGPPLGRAFLEPGAERLWPEEAAFVFGRVEPVKHGRYVVALLGPALLAGVVLLGARRPPRLRADATRALVTASQWLLVPFAILAVLGQDSAILPLHPPIAKPWHVFEPGRYAFALLAPLAALALLRRRPALAGRIAAAARETRAKRIACLAAAVAFAALWLLPAVDSDATIGLAPGRGLIPWVMNDPFAILDGRAPLAGYHAMYAQLWPYASAAALALFGTTITVFTLAQAAIAGLALLAVYATLRRVVRGSSLLALALWLPFVSIGFVLVRLEAHPPIWFSNARVFSIWPLRYAGAYLLAWLTARHLDGAPPRRAWGLFLAAGLVVLNNVEFGAGALAATVVALACRRELWSRWATLRTAGEALAGLLVALLAIALLTLAVGGALPRLGDELEFPRIFGVLGLTDIPAPVFGLHLLLYATFAGAIATAAVRVARGAEQLLTGLLAWSGVFGLVAASYWIGRSDDLKLVALFSTWAFALALLAVVVVRGLAARGWRRPTVAQYAVLAGVALATTAILELPSPWSQARRLGLTTAAPTLEGSAAWRFVAADTRRGERVVILIGLGDRIAHDLGLVNVSPYAFLESIVTQRQFDATLAAARAEGAQRLFLPADLLVAAHRAELQAAGFHEQRANRRFAEWTDLEAGPG